MSEVNILHLSDIHFKSAEAEDYKTGRKMITKKLIAAITEFTKKNPTPDYIAVTGDIAFSGTEYTEAGEFFQTLRTILPAAVILPVPGNHDLNRKEINEFLSLQGIVTDGRAEKFLENSKQVRQEILPKFSAFQEFVRQWNDGLYCGEDDYFWVYSDQNRNLSFLGLNSCWACEGNLDQMHIALGYPQLVSALDRSEETACRILLMHHPPVNWLKDFERGPTAREVFRNCCLVLHGHTHGDSALVWTDPSDACICIGANASYTNHKENGFLGFQFIHLEWTSDNVKAKIWPYILDDRRYDFVPDRERWRSQNGKPFFELMGRTDPLETMTPATVPDFPAVYRDWIMAFHSQMDIEHLSRKGEAITVDLPELYIPLETVNPFHREELETALKKRNPKGDLPEDSIEQIETTETPYIDIEKLLSREKCLVLRGPAGMGKTTLVKHLTYAAAHGKSVGDLNQCLPIMILFRDLWRVFEREAAASTGIIDFEHLLPKYLEKVPCPLPMNIVLSYIANDRAMFLFDGLDEAPDHLRPDLVQLIAGFYLKHRNNRFVFTGRPHGVDATVTKYFGKYIFDIEPLNARQIQDFISSWFRVVSRQAVGLAGTSATGLISDIRENEPIQIFTQNPLLLTAVCVLYIDGRRLPDQRADLYNRLVDNLVYRRFHDIRKPEMENKVKEFLMKLAYTMHQEHRKTSEQQQVSDIIKSIFTTNSMENPIAEKYRLDALLDEVEPNCGLLSRTASGEIEFNHLTFQEFLAAKYLYYMDLDIECYLNDPWWEEVILMYAGLMNMERKSASNDLVRRVLQAGGTEMPHRLVNLAGKALRDFEPAKRDPAAVNAVRHQLYRVMNSDAPVLARFEAGEIVGILGDLRIRGTDRFVVVDAGEFIRGSKKGDGYENECPQKKIFLDAYYIDRFPVTNEEFQPFVAGDGYHNQQYWSRDGWKWREKDQIIEPEYWHDRKWNGSNFPVVGVSWYEAAAFAEWLRVQTGLPYRLPSEAEWEKAARGTQGRVFPWGNAVISDACNSRDILFLGWSSPVGIFPAGISPFQCLDMAGNVWEWCADWYDGKYYKLDDIRNPQGPDFGGGRVLRGGAWTDPVSNCRASQRSVSHPSSRYVSMGFRLARSIP